MNYDQLFTDKECTVCEGNFTIGETVLKDADGKLYCEECFKDTFGE